jgi:D-lactate dehydrogenase
MANSTMEEALLLILPPERVKLRYIDLVSFAADAGFYYLVPKAVVQPNNEKEVISLFHFSSQHSIPVVFRGGGTSLSGQSITDGILIDLSQFWNKVWVEDSGNRVRVQPGVTGQMVNAHLKVWNKKIGPDPSSISAAMMGGILSNNASGMCCGVKFNSYHTTRYIRFILPDGKTFDTEKEADYLRFQTECAELSTVLISIKTEIESSSSLFQKVRDKYITKNTVGYSLNAFIDYDHPLDILAHLLIGAEGSLAFISEAVLTTVPDYPFKSTALIYFPDIYSACQAIGPLTQAGAKMIELMDRASLRSVQDLKGMPETIQRLPATAAALLVEFQEQTPDELKHKVNLFLQSASSLTLNEFPVFTTDAPEREFLWKVRKGLFPAVGAVRARGTSVILEDLAFPVEKLGDAISDLQKLFLKYHYPEAIIFGHAKDGNIHFVITQTFDSPAEILRYDQFMREVVLLVVDKYHGSLKAEHGTGRNMAPFVETEWGGEAYAIMKRIKSAIDPDMLLNPGVIINNDDRAHLKNLKTLPVVEQEVDKCIECGYCEHKCPSRNITTTPRRRIVIRRVLKNLQNAGDQANYQLLLKQYQYEGLDTCAVDGLCATACPVDINTGDLVKRLRAENHSAFENRLALMLQKNLATVEWLVRAGLKTGFLMNYIFGRKTMFRFTRFLRKMSPSIPVWTNQIGLPARLDMYTSGNREEELISEKSIVYFPACITRMLGTYKGKKKNLLETFMSICRKTGVHVEVIKNINGSCCSQIYSSKGFHLARQRAANDIIFKLWTASKKGLLPVVTDVSSCAYTLQQLRTALTAENQNRFDQLKISDSVEYFHDLLVGKCKVNFKKNNIVLHPVCSLEKMKTVNKFVSMAGWFSHNVKVPLQAGCCGMAGDRGFIFPELTDSATAGEAAEVKQNQYEGYYSSTKTCEMAMEKAVSKNYESILYLIDEAL